MPQLEEIETRWKREPFVGSITRRGAFWLVLGAGKTAYPNPQAAHAQAARVSKRKARRGRRNPRAYKCLVCGAWHVGESKF